MGIPPNNKKPPEQNRTVFRFNTASGKRVHATENGRKNKRKNLVSIPQAVRGCMQLCVPEPLWDKPSKWGFGQETSFSIVFAISEHVRLLFFQKGIGSNPSPSRVSGTHVQIGQVFVSRRSFPAFAHNLPTYIFYPNLPAFSIPFTKKTPRSFRFTAGRNMVCAHVFYEANHNWAARVARSLGVTSNASIASLLVQPFFAINARTLFKMFSSRPFSLPSSMP